MQVSFDTSISSLLDLNDTPKFDHLDASTIEPAVTHALNRCRETVEAIVAGQENLSFPAVIEPLEVMGHMLERIWSPVSHLNAVASSDEIREAHNRCLELLTTYWSEIGQNKALYEAYLHIRQSENNLSPAQKRLLDLAIRNFELAGVGLPEDQRKKYTDIKLKLSALQSKFEENVLDSSNAWSYAASNEDELDGLPENVMARASADANGNGWKFSLDHPTFAAVISHAKNSDLRKRFYDAWVTRASTAGEHDAKFDNSDIIREILALRQSLAELLSFANYAEYSLALKMAESGESVIGFIRDLAQRSRRAASRELDALQAFAGKELQPWDLGFYAERLREDQFSISDEMLRPYFPLNRALSGLFKIVENIFDITISEVPVAHSWHEDVRMFEITRKDGSRAGRFYTDLFARPKKRGGAWMSECVGHNRITGEDGMAVAFLVCNFMPATGDKPALLTHDEIVTLFHEFGHTLHMLLSTVAYPGVAGINGVPWDAVELPSQFMENFAWQADTLPMISEHYLTGEAMPKDLFERLLGSRKFHAGLQSVRQLEFALFDMRLHMEADSGKSYAEILAEVRDEVAVVPVAANNRFANAFSHIFAGGYAAGYYSYKWAEVLSADAFSAFEETGILDFETGKRFRQSILEQGGSVDAMEAFVRFRGREPTTDALVRHNGLDAA